MLEKFLKLGKIGRRYFVLNSFDGVLTTLGIVMGLFISGVQNPLVPISTGIGALIALGISGFSSAYMAERAEREKDLKDLEGKMLKGMDGTYHEKKLKKLSLKASIVNGLSPFVTGLMCILPFALSFVGIIPMNLAYSFSIAMSLVILSFLGYFLGSVSKERKIISALKMLIVGIITAAILYLLGGI